MFEIKPVVTPHEGVGKPTITTVDLFAGAGGLRTLRPKVFVKEYVPEFQRSTQFEELRDLLEIDTELGACCAADGVLNAANYGVPQSRRRGILVAIRDLCVRRRGTDPILDGGGRHLHFGRRSLATSMEQYRAIPPPHRPPGDLTPGGGTAIADFVFEHAFTETQPK